MAYFECIIGSGGGGTQGIPLIVTCSAQFAGSTITATKSGAATQTATCPSSSPYTVEFELPEDGTWTVSGVASGQTFSEVVTITPYTATLNAIPEGATVTPTNVIQTWLNCANIWDKTYTTINQVLSDTTTLLALISSTNAVDYMVRSTTWASSVCANSTAMTYIGNNNYCANKLLANSTWRTAICNSTYFERVLNVKVPSMTSNTTPSGTVTSNKTPSYSDLYNAFDGGAGSTPTQFNSGDNVNLDYTFPNNVKIYKIGYHSTTLSAATTLLLGFTLNISCGKNGSFSSIASRTFTQAEAQNAQSAWLYFNVSSIASGNTIRASIANHNYGVDSFTNIGGLQYYGRADV